MHKFKQFLEQHKHSNVDEERYLIRVRHVLMCTYGWIPLEQYEAMSITEVNDLLKEIEYDRKQEEAAMNKAKR